MLVHAWQDYSFGAGSALNKRPDDPIETNSGQNSGQMGGMKVVVHRNSMIGPVAYHDWVQVGDIHYELCGISCGSANKFTLDDEATGKKRHGSGCSLGGKH